VSVFRDQTVEARFRELRAAENVNSTAFHRRMNTLGREENWQPAHWFPEIHRVLCDILAALRAEKLTNRWPKDSQAAVGRKEEG
jgi:hypothetical protein